MRNFNQFIRCLAFTTVMTYACYTADSMFDKYMAVEMASVDAEAEMSRGTTIGGCATDTECHLAEVAAVMAVAKERGLGSYGGGGNTQFAKR
jgi:hypothetical protein